MTAKSLGHCEHRVWWERQLPAGTGGDGGSDPAPLLPFAAPSSGPSASSSASKPAAPICRLTAGASCSARAASSVLLTSPGMFCWPPAGGGSLLPKRSSPILQRGAWRRWEGAPRRRRPNAGGTAPQVCQPGRRLGDRVCETDLPCKASEVQARPPPAGRPPGSHSPACCSACMAAALLTAWSCPLFTRVAQPLCVFQKPASCRATQRMPAAPPPAHRAAAAAR